MKKTIVNNDIAIVDFLADLDPKHVQLKLIQHAPEAINQSGGTYFISCKSYKEEGIVMLCYYQRAFKSGNHMRLFVAPNVKELIKILIDFFYNPELSTADRWHVSELIEALKKHINQLQTTKS